MGWIALESYADLKLMDSTLKKQNFTDIIVLGDKLSSNDAGNKKITKKDIENAFHTLLSHSKPGDIVLVHYSGHGQQIFDEGNSVTGYDASIIPYGAYSQWVDKKDNLIVDQYHGENHIRGKEIGKYLDSLRAKVQSGGQVIFTFDCCCSQGATRGICKSRGTELPFEPQGYAKKHASNFKKFKFDDEVSNEKKLSGSMAPYIAIEAAQQNEEDEEMCDDDGNYFGSLTFAICKALNSKGLQKDISYRQLFVSIEESMKAAVPNQKPVIEGDQDNIVFGSGVVKQESYFTISGEAGNNGITINGGSIQGINKGTKISLYPAGTTSIATAASIAHIDGTVDSTTPFSSFVALEKPLSGKTGHNAWAFVTAYTCGEIRIKVSLKNIRDANLANELKKSIFFFPFAILDDNASDVFFDAGNHADGQGYDLDLKYSNGGAVFNTIHNFTSSKDSSKIQGMIKKFAQIKYLRTISLSDSNYSVQVKLLSLPKNMKAVTEINCALAERYYDSLYAHGSPSFDTSENPIIIIKNTGRNRAYFNILDIQPDGIINVQIPQASGSNNGLDDPGNCVLDPGKCVVLSDKDSKLIHLILGPPFGTELWKVFAAKDPMDFRSLNSSRGVATRGAAHTTPVEALFQNSFMTRGARMANTTVPSNNGSSYDYFFNIVSSNQNP
jgi:metacaspase-1